MIKVTVLEHTPNLEELIAKSAKLCYSSSTIEEISDNLTKENVDKFISMLASIGHESPLEHASFTFGIEGVSRSLTHQLVRHRLASYSQKSQRYVKEDQFEYVIPKEIEKIEELKEEFIQTMYSIQTSYDYFVDELMDNYIYKYLVEETKLYTPDIQQEREFMHNILKTRDKSKYQEFEKRAIENARYILPNACETKIIMTMNLRSLLHFFNERCCTRAQDEIRELAFAMLKECRKISPLLFKKAGAKCVKGYCPEGKMSCGKVKTLIQIIKENNHESNP